MELIDKEALLKHECEADRMGAMLVVGKGHILSAPTVDAVPVVRGEWRQGKEFSACPRVPFIPTAYYCSNCEGEAYWDTDYGQQLFSFCQNCGADMRGSRGSVEKGKYQ